MDQRPTNQSGLSGTAMPEVFVVDDEPMVLELAALLLKPQGYRVTCFRDPPSALAAFSAAASATTPPELLITDYAMQGMNGLELMRACRKLRSGQKVLMISGTVDEQFVRASQELPDFFLAKPFQNVELIRAIKQLLSENGQELSGAKALAEKDL